MITRLLACFVFVAAAWAAPLGAAPASEPSAAAASRPAAATTTAPASAAPTTKPATAPAATTAPAPGTDPFTAALAARVRAIVKDLSHQLPARREAAQKALLELGEGVFNQLVEQIQLDDPEQVARVAEVFAGLGTAARQAELLMRAGPAQRRYVLDLARRFPKQFNELLSHDDRVVASAISVLGRQNHPGAELVLTWACRQADWEVRQAALDTILSSRRDSVAVRDLLAERMNAMDAGLLGPNVYHGQGGQDVRQVIERNEYRTVLQALVSAKDPRVLPRLLQPLIGSAQQYHGQPNEALDMILELKDKRTVVTLMDEVDNKTQITNIGFGDGKQVKVQRGDVAMAIILTQTGQDLVAYGYHRPPNWTPQLTQMGFVSDQKRQEAQRKLADWFQKHQKEYEGVEKVPLGGDDIPRSGALPSLPAFLKKLGG